MAESTLSLDYTALMNAVAYFLYGKTDSDTLNETEQVVVNRAIQAGYRQFLYPPAFEGVFAHEWTFLRPVTTIDTVASDADQDLPDDFGRLIGGFAYAAGAQVPPVLADVGEGYIRRLRMSMEETGRPKFAAVRIKAGTGTEGQRREVMWYPTPDDAYTLSYKYEAFTGALDADNNPYPLGAMKHGETLKASCLAVADLDVNDERGARWDDFIRQLAASIQRDKREGAKFFGHVGSGDQYESSSVSGMAAYPYSLTAYGTVIQ
jgi:hypothetical protein